MCPYKLDAGPNVIFDNPSCGCSYRSHQLITYQEVRSFLSSCLLVYHAQCVTTLGSILLWVVIMLLDFTVVLCALALGNYIFAAALVPDLVEANESGSVLRIGDILYYTPHFPYATYKPKGSGVPPATGFTAVTSIRTTSSPITKAYLEQHFTFYSEFDDVYSDHFMDSLIISYDGIASASFEANAESWLETLNIRHLYLSERISPPKVKTLQISQIKEGPPAGPYFASMKAGRLDLHSAYRLYKDEYEAFLFGAVPQTDGGWFPTNITLDDDGQQYIHIPSRLSAMTQSLPLAGTRFALKDIYDAQGLKTGAGSLAYARAYPEANMTASSIQRLFALGATMVGKVRTSQFAHGSNPWDFIDIPYSWNPRADGYLTASASSTGSACAIAGYEWLDFTVGSDTRGSVRKPATLVGAYGIRPTHGSMDLTGVVPLSDEMDTAGYFTRDPRLFSEIGHLWLVYIFILRDRTWTNNSRTGMWTRQLKSKDSWIDSLPSFSIRSNTFLRRTQQLKSCLTPSQMLCTSIYRSPKYPSTSPTRSVPISPMATSTSSRSYATILPNTDHGSQSASRSSLDTKNSLGAPQPLILGPSSRSSTAGS